MLRSYCICSNEKQTFTPVIVYRGETVFREYEGCVIGKCKACGMLKTVVQKSTKKTDDPISKAQYYEQHSENFHHQFDALSQTILRYKQSGKLLDVGCASGILMEVMQPLGFEVYGVEPNKKAVALARKKFGSRVHHGTLPSLQRFKKMKFDVIVYNHVLEHIPQVYAEIAAVKRLLKKDGLLIIGVPNVANVVYAIRGKYWESLLPDQHIWHFSTKHLEKLLRTNGFEILQTTYSNHIRDDYPLIKKIYFRILTLINTVCNTGEAVLLVAKKNE